MATIGGYNVVTNGLVLSLDAANARSYVSGSSTWFDVSGYNYSGSLVNGPGFDPNNGGSITFDGTNQYVVSTNNSFFVNNKITLSSWYKILSIPSTFSQVFGSNNANGAIYIDALGRVFSQLSFTIAGNKNIGYYPLSLNTWYNSVLTWQNGDTLKHYVNGNLVAETSIITDTIGTFSGYYFAKYSSGTNLYCQIANGMYYNRALSAAEVSQNYNIYKLRFGL